MQDCRIWRRSKRSRCNASKYREKVRGVYALLQSRKKDSIEYFVEKEKIEEAVNEISGEVTEISENNEIKPENDNDEEEKISGENI